MPTFHTSVISVNWLVPTRESLWVAQLRLSIPQALTHNNYTLIWNVTHLILSPRPSCFSVCNMKSWPGTRLQKIVYYIYVITNFTHPHHPIPIHFKFGLGRTMADQVAERLPLGLQPQSSAKPNPAIVTSKFEGHTIIFILPVDSLLVILTWDPPG